MFIVAEVSEDEMFVAVIDTLLVTLDKTFFAWSIALWVALDVTFEAKLRSLLASFIAAEVAFVVAFGNAANVSFAKNDKIMNVKRSKTIFVWNWLGTISKGVNLYEI